MARMKLLCLSNGHGEDAIALKILLQLQQCPNPPEIAALPIVGQGQAYLQHQIPVIGQVKTMPSGGFVYMDGRQLARDLQGGLLQLTLSQLKTIRTWAQSGGVILAVGDIVPLLFAWWSGAPYAFVGTAKSEYYLRDEQGILQRQNWFDQLESAFGSVYLPWERWLMSRDRCKAVFPRDTLTTEILQKWPIPAFDVGNPMMDGFAETAGERGKGKGERGEHRCTQMDTDGQTAEPHSRRVEPYSPLPTPHSPLPTSPSPHPPIHIALLPGSRPSEAYRNWETILAAVMALVEAWPDRRLCFWGAIASTLELDSLVQPLLQQGWNAAEIQEFNEGFNEGFNPELDGELNEESLQTIAIEQIFRIGSATLCLTQSAFSQCLCRADLAIAMTGTGTEQFVGLGKPAVILPGLGPQFTPAFAEAQTRLLGCSTILVQQPVQVPDVIEVLLQDRSQLEKIRENGRRRMGQPGASQRIAKILQEHLVYPVDP